MSAADSRRYWQVAMPELLLLSLPTDLVENLHKASADPATADLWRGLWREQYPDSTIIETVCFTCDRPVPFPPVGLILPDPDMPSRRLIVPLCEEKCGARPLMQRYGRALRLLKALYKARTGKNLNLHFNPPLRRHPR